MANSFSFNSVDMADYGLRLRRHDEPFAQETEGLQLLDRAHGLGSRRPAVTIDLAVVVVAASFAALVSNLDDIKAALNYRTEKSLAFDSVTDRYWLARFKSITKTAGTATTWEGAIAFDIFDPAAYATAETDHDHTVDEDPETVTETASGTEQAQPFITLTCDSTLTAATVEIENETSGETIEWTGDLVANDVLTIDCETGVVKLNGVEDMETVDGQFLHLLAGDNSIVITGFSGNLNFTYRARYV